MHGGMTHISGPLSRIYAELWRTQMCYGRCDQILQETERRWSKTYSAVYGVNSDAANDALDLRIEELNRRADLCCGDVLVALADDVDLIEGL